MWPSVLHCTFGNADREGLEWHYHEQKLSYMYIYIFQVDINLYQVHHPHTDRHQSRLAKGPTGAIISSSQWLWNKCSTVHVVQATFLPHTEEANECQMNDRAREVNQPTPFGDVQFSWLNFPGTVYTGGNSTTTPNQQVCACVMVSSTHTPFPPRMTTPNRTTNLSSGHVRI